jgi:hypothetical protein
MDGTGGSADDDLGGCSARPGSRSDRCGSTKPMSSADRMSGLIAMQPASEQPYCWKRCVALARMRANHASGRSVPDVITAWIVLSPGNSLASVLSMAGEE